MRRIVIPGEFITDKRVKLGPYVFVENGKVYSKVLGLLEEKEGFVRVIPLEGRYMPKPGDMVIGIITDVKINGYEVDINSPYTAFLPESEIKDDVSYGDVIMAVISSVDPGGNVVIKEAKQLKGGEVITIIPAKVPRVIGKNASMLEMIKELTGCAVIVGNNGRIWISGERSDVVKAAVRMIEREAHTSGLTDRVNKMIREEMGYEA